VDHPIVVNSNVFGISKIDSGVSESKDSIVLEIDVT